MKYKEYDKTITSKEISELTGKNHSHVMRDIRSIEENLTSKNDEDLLSLKSDSLTNPNMDSLWHLGSYVDSKGERRPVYRLSKKGSLLLATKYDDKLRLKVINRWEELELKETKPTLPQNYEEALVELLTNVRALNETNEKLEVEKKKNEENRPKVVFAESVMGSNNSILIREFAKIISDNSFTIGQNRLFVWFRENGYLNSKNEPYQNFVDRGYFEVIERSIGSGVETFTSRTTKITGAGQIYFTKKIRPETKLQLN